MHRNSSLRHHCTSGIWILRLMKGTCMIISTRSDKWFQFVLSSPFSQNYFCFIFFV
ncbi:hypothetical protein AHAS_Ahas18G0114100 [Arachis hypogaea]